ncbi:MAG TPA: hypothetical protein VK469_11765, partial [Candidatus Kapabacteria bacterium]|nr:hypothetical protein [Candidatus Kapabacteria bacterium]
LRHKTLRRNYTRNRLESQDCLNDPEMFHPLKQKVKSKNEKLKIKNGKRMKSPCPLNIGFVFDICFWDIWICFEFGFRISDFRKVENWHRLFPELTLKAKKLRTRYRQK